MKRRGIVFGLMGLLLLASPAWALITRLTPLKDVVEESQFIFTVKVDSVDADKLSLVLTVDDQLKGKAPFQKLTVLLKGDAEAMKGKQTPDLLKRVAPKLPVVLFVSQRDTTFIAFAFTNGTWFQLKGVKDDDSDTVRWSFTHLEPYLRRTFKGTTGEMQKVVADFLNDKDKKTLPDTDPKEKPGLGPEIEPEKKETKPEEEKVSESRSNIDRRSFRGTVTTGPVFGVIPAVLIGGPLAMLAMLFPSVFGGWKRWLTLLSVACTNSTLYTLQFWFAADLSGTVWGRASTLWIMMALVTLAGTVLAFVRHGVRVMDGEAPYTPSKIELLVLGIVSLTGAGILGYATLNKQSLLSPDWMPVLPYCLSAWGATVYVLYAGLVPRRLPALATEAVMLAIMAFVTVGLMMTTGTHLQLNAANVASTGGDVPPKIVWKFTAPAKGSIFSTPLVAGERVYVGVAHDDVFSPYGVLYCLDGSTGKEIWRFPKDKSMRQLYSTPCLAEGMLYIGEGLHQDAACKIYCLRADTGEKIWDFATDSHTESSPCVVTGKLYCGAGDDGLYCLDAKTGNKLWNFPGFHIDTNPIVSGNHVFAGAGVGDIYKEPAILCLNAETGAKEWLIKTALPAWGSPSVFGDCVYFGLGNGRVGEKDPNPAGELLCVRAADGSIVWHSKVDDAVLGKPSLDYAHVYFGSSDNRLYCINRMNGKQCWQCDLGSPVIAPPTLVPCPFSEATLRLYGVGSDGQVVSLEANTGRVLWSLHGEEVFSSPVEVIAPPALEVAQEGQTLRRFYLGATLVSTARTAVLYCFEEVSQGSTPYSSK
jgi:outer membrane protein assembly factor BamB